jgi:hypothetical protein
MAKSAAAMRIRLIATTASTLSPSHHLSVEGSPIIESRVVDQVGQQYALA